MFPCKLHRYKPAKLPFQHETCSSLYGRATGEEEVHERSAHDVPCHADVLLLSVQASPLLDAAVDWSEVDLVDLLSLQASPLLDAAVDWPEVDLVDLLSLQASPLLDAAFDWPVVDVVGRLCPLDFPFYELSP